VSGRGEGCWNTAEHELCLTLSTIAVDKHVADIHDGAVALGGARLDDDEDIARVRPQLLHRRIAQARRAELAQRVRRHNEIVLFGRSRERGQVTLESCATDRRLERFDGIYKNKKCYIFVPERIADIPLIRSSAMRSIASDVSTAVYSTISRKTWSAALEWVR